MLMAAMMPREKWTDDRLDDLNKKVEDGFARLDKKIDDGFARVDADIREIRTDMNSRFEALNRTLIGAAAVVVAAVIGSNAF
jgi:hypothetical protein